MSSSEEYLDNLLKSLTEGGSNGNEEPSPSMTQDMVGSGDTQETSAPEEADNTMSMDDIEAMLTSMGEETTEEPQADEAVSVDEGMMSDELALDEGMLSDELALDEGMLSDELALDEGMLSDELALDEGMLSDELVLDDSMLSDELPADDGILTDELVLNEETATDEPAPDDSVLSDELTLDDSMPSGELALDDSMLSDELGLGDEMAVDDLVVDDVMTDESASEENTSSEDLSLDELGLGDLGLEDLGLEEIGQDESEAGDDFALEDGPEAGDDLAPEDESEAGSDPALEGGAEAGDDFALEESGEDDAELSALLASMGGDEDLSEINDLLEKSEQGIAVDDDMMAMLGDVSNGEEGDDAVGFFSEEKMAEGDPGNIREITPEELEERENQQTKKQKKKEEKERKKREKQAKKAKNKNASPDENAGEDDTDDLNGLLDGIGESEDEPKKQGFFAKFLAFLLEEDEEENDSAESGSNDDGVIIGNLSDENKELLEELKAEDQQNAKKKDKKEKKAKKGKKGKKGKAEAGAEGEGEEAEAKPKKPKKEKKKKEKDTEEEPKIPEKKLSKKKVASVFLFCATIAACIVVLTMILPEQMEKQEARMAFDHGQYTQVYEMLYGKKLSEEDEVLLHKSSIILKMQRKLDSYENYKKMDMRLEALNALIEGVNRYQNLSSDAVSYNVSGEVTDIYHQILVALASDFGLSESDALDIISSGDDVTYSQRLQAVISGEAFGTEEEPAMTGKQDVLPEEEEIIDRLEGTE